MTDKVKFYTRLTQQITALSGPDIHWLSTLANTTALLWLELEDINWVGFYLAKNDQLILGPFQGNPACTHIAIGQGVCGSAFAEKTIFRVSDVHQFPGHIACDAASQSEIVLPLYTGSQLIGVLDIDSPSINRFDGQDEAGLAELLVQLSDHLSEIEF
ncbi:GAF domain-containing protein [Celerinatantimonas yamalensis]|uniref:GAF domain-containing protein n=1 Tax=Celerinatantimonas yamalensis TaxID=559956 RepID=A0ABW9G2Z7_9GAMM